MDCEGSRLSEGSLVEISTVPGGIRMETYCEDSHLACRIISERNRASAFLACTGKGAAFLRGYYHGAGELALHRSWNHTDSVSYVEHEPPHLVPLRYSRQDRGISDNVAARLNSNQINGLIDSYGYLIGVYKHLKDKFTPVTDKLRLATYGWLSDRVYIPNKEQVILDLVTGLLVNKKRYKLSESEREAVWRCLHQLLQTNKAHRKSKHGQGLTIKSSFCQVVCDALQDQIGSEKERPALKSVIDSCHSIINSPLLAHVFTSRLDQLVLLYSQLLKCGCSLITIRSEVMEDTLTLVCKLTELYLQSQMSSPSQKAVLSMTVDKLLLPSVVLSHELSLMDQCTDRPVHAIAGLRTLDAIIQTIFHTDHKDMYTSYFLACDGGSKSAVPKTLEQLFSTLTEALNKQTKFKFVSVERICDATLAFLPTFYERFVAGKSPGESCRNAMLVRLCCLMGIPPEGCTPETRGSYVMEPGIFDCVRKLLKVVHQWEVYSITQDNENDNRQLKFYRHLLEILLVQPPCGSLIDCLSTMLQLNHVILEPQLKPILQLTWFSLVQDNGEFVEKLDSFLSDLVSTYSQLRQLNRWLDKVLSALRDTASIPLPITCPTAFSNRLSELIQALPQGMMVDIWSKCVEEIRTHYLPALIQDKSLVFSFSLVVDLLSTLLMNVRVAEYAITDITAKSVQELITSIETQVLTNLMQVCVPHEKNFDLIFSVLLLCHGWGELQLLLTQHGKGMSGQSSPPSLCASSASDLTSVHPYLSSDQWRFLGQHIQRRGDAKSQYLLSMLHIQKLRSLLLFGKSSHLGYLTSVQNVVDQLVTLPGLTELTEPGTARWDGKLRTLSKANLLVARWKLMLDHLPLIMPILSDDQLTSISNFIVQSSLLPVIKPSQQSCHSVRSVTYSTLRDPQLCEHRKLMSSLLTSLWTFFSSSFTSKKSVKKRKLESSQGLICAVFDELCDPSVRWQEISSTNHSSVAGQLGTLSAKMNDLMKTSPTNPNMNEEQIHRCLQVLAGLPVEHFSPGEQLRCLCGLVTLMIMLNNGREPVEEQTIVGTDQANHPEFVAQMMDIVSCILESSSRCAFLNFVNIDTLLSWGEGLLMWSRLQGVGSDLVKSCRQMLELVVRGVTREFSLLSKMDGYISKLVCRLKRTCQASMGEEVSYWHDHSVSLLTMISLITQQLSKLLKWSYLKSEIKEQCWVYVHRLSSSYLHCVDDVCGGQSALPGFTTCLLDCYSTALPLFCDSSSCEETLSHKADRASLTELVRGKFGAVIDLVLEQINENEKDQELLGSCLQMVNTVCGCSGQLSVEFTSAHRDKIWVSLTHLLSQHLQVDYVKVEGGTEEAAMSQSIVQNICVTMATLIASCDPDQFGLLIHTVVEDCHPHHVLEQSWRIQSSMLIWDQLLACNLSQQHVSAFCQAIQNTLINCQSILEEVRWLEEADYLDNIMESLLQLETRLLEFGEVLMPKQTALLCLHGCQVLPLETTGIEAYLRLFNGSYEVLNALLVNHTDAVLGVIPTFVNCSKLLLKSVIHRGKQTQPPLVSPHTEGLVLCAHQLHRLYSLLACHKREFGKVAVYLVADYVSEVQQVTLIPAVKNSLLPAIYKLLSICDQHSIALLHTVLNQGVKEIFKLVYADYTRYYKYTGRV